MWHFFKVYTPCANLTKVLMILQGYAYILTHPGQPTVFYDHFFDWGENIRNAIIDLVRLVHNLFLEFISNSNLILSLENVC